MYGRSGRRIVVNVVEKVQVGEKLPKRWKWVRLGDVCDTSSENRDPRLEPNKPFHYVDIASIDNASKQILDFKTLLGKDAPSRARQVIRTENVIVSTTRPNLNAVALVPQAFENQICSTGFCVLRASKAIEPKYLFNFVQSSDFVQNLSNLVKGALYPAVTDRQVLDQLIPLPPHPEQKRIVAILTDRLSTIDEARTATEAQLKTAKALPAAYLREVFDSPEAQKWERKALRELCKEKGQYGTSVQSNNSNDGVPVLRMGNIFEGELRWDNLKYTNLPDLEEKKYLLKKGDVLFNRTNSAELVGKTAVFDGSCNAIFASYLIRFRIDEALANPHFLTSYINSHLGRRFIEANMARAIGQVNISASVMHTMPVPTPTVSKQKEIGENLIQRREQVRHLVQSLQSQLNTINKLPAALLRQAFNGEL